MEPDCLVMTPRGRPQAQTPSVLVTSKEHWWNDFEHHWSYDFDIRTWTELPQVDMSMVGLVQDAVFRPGHLVCSDSEIMPLSQVALDEVKRKSKGWEEKEKEGKVKKAGSTIAHRSLAGMPALQRMMQQASSTSSHSQKPQKRFRKMEDSDGPETSEDEKKDDAATTDEEKALEKVFKEKELERGSWHG
eukprot:3265157-Lingulodinium_polyedra.AAC.1